MCSFFFFFLFLSFFSSFFSFFFSFFFILLGRFYSSKDEFLGFFDKHNTHTTDRGRKDKDREISNRNENVGDFLHDMFVL